MEGQEQVLPPGGAVPWGVPPPPPGWGPAQQPAYNPLGELIGVIKSVLWGTGFASFILMLVLSFVIVMAMTPEIQQWIATPVPSSADPANMVLPREHIFIITPWPLLIFSINGPAFQAWHFLMLSILVSAFAVAKYDMFKSWLSARGNAVRCLLVPEKATSSLEGTAKLFMASISFSIAYFIFLSIINVDMNTPDFASLSRPELIYGLFSASVFEELISRVLLVGIPLAVIGALMGWKSPARRVLGGGMDLTPVTLALIAISSVMFAFAHVGSWDLWKVPQVLITGLALGWAFVRYGLHASILIHFSINLGSSSLQIWPDSMALTALLGIVMLIWMVAGGYFFLHYCIELAMRLAPRKKPLPAYAHASQWVQQQAQSPPPHWQHTPLPPPPPSWAYGQGTAPPPPWAYGPPQQPQPVQQAPATQAAAQAAQPTVPPPQPNKEGISKGFVCTKCGHTDASYDAGRLTCMRCGAAHYRDAPVAASTQEKTQYEF